MSENDDQVRKPTPEENELTCHIKDLYQKKIPSIMFRIGLFVLIGTIASISHLFLVTSSLGVTSILDLATSIPGALIISILICAILSRENSFVFSILVAVSVMLLSEFFIFHLGGTVSHTDARTTPMRLILSSIICISILVPSMRLSEKKSWFPKKKLSTSTVIFLFLTFSSLYFMLAFPISKLYNYRQIETAQMLVENLEITQKEDYIEILLPPEYTKYNNYLKNTLSIGWLIDSLSGESLKILWEKEYITCREGKKKWCITRIPFPDRLEGELMFHFKHPWKDYETTTKRFIFPKP